MISPADPLFWIAPFKFAGMNAVLSGDNAAGPAIPIPLVIFGATRLVRGGDRAPAHPAR